MRSESRPLGGVLQNSRTLLQNARPAYIYSVISSARNVGAKENFPLLPLDVNPGQCRALAPWLFRND